MNKISTTVVELAAELGIRRVYVEGRGYVYAETREEERAICEYMAKILNKTAPLSPVYSLAGKLGKRSWKWLDVGASMRCG